MRRAAKMLRDKEEILEMLANAADWPPPQHPDPRSVEEIMADLNRQGERRLKEVVAILHRQRKLKP